ncbi:MAG: PAS domain-containing protein, partial [Actinomycetota bacterium]
MTVPMGDSVKNRVWIAYVAAALATVGGYYAMGQKDVVFHAIGLSAAVVILAGVALFRPRHKLPWILFAVGQTLFVGGDVISYNYEKFFHAPLPFPAISDVLYLLVYPCLVAGLLLISRRRSASSDRGSLIDAAMIAIGIGVVSWVFLIAPYVHETSLRAIEKATAMAYPLMDLLLMAVVTRLAVGAGRKAASFYLIALGVVALFVTDAIYGWLLLHSGYEPGSGPLEAGWSLFYILLGAAALHPSMRTVSEPAPEVEAHVSPARLAFLAAACLLAPATQAVAAIRGDLVDLPVVLGATITLFVLAVIRMAGLVRQQVASATRERALREAGSALVTATNREGIYEATLRAAQTVAGDRSVLRLLTLEEGRLHLVASVGGEGAGETSVPFDALDDWKRDRLTEHRSYQVPVAEFRYRESLGFPVADASVLVSPMFVRDELHALMVVAVTGTFTQATTHTMEALASQAALALESAVLTEELLMQQSEARFASLVRNASDVVTVIDADSTIRYASPSSMRTLGYEPEALEGTRFIDLVHDDDKARAFSFMTAGVEGEDSVGLLELRVRHSDGAYLFAETQRTNLVHDPNVKGIVLTTRDISERKEFEEQLSHQAFHD